nr:MAG TPA: hypothetical protein [Microviridae sp.]
MLYNKLLMYKPMSYSNKIIRILVLSLCKKTLH